MAASAFASLFSDCSSADTGASGSRGGGKKRKTRFDDETDGYHAASGNGRPGEGSYDGTLFASHTPRRGAGHGRCSDGDRNERHWHASASSDAERAPRRDLAAGNAEHFWRLRDPQRFSRSPSREGDDSQDEAVFSGQERNGVRFSGEGDSVSFSPGEGMEAREERRENQRRRARRGRRGTRDGARRGGAGEAEGYFFVPADECPICWEQQNFVMRNTRPAAQSAGGAAGAAADVQQSQSALVQRINDYRKVIFDLERSLRTAQNDAIVWKAILMARQEFIERHLREYGVTFTPWTKEMLQRHYDVRNEHTFDLERDYRAEEREMRKIQQNIIKSALYMKTAPPDVDEGGEGGEDNVAVNLRSAEMVIKLSKRRQELNKAIEDSVKGRAEDTQASSREIINLLQGIAAERQAPGAYEAGAAGGGAAFDENADLAGERPSDVIAEMYNVGGL